MMQTMQPVMAVPASYGTAPVVHSDGMYGQNYGVPGGGKVVGGWKGIYVDGPNTWQAGNGCDCLVDPANAIYACCCPCCVLCDNAEMLKMNDPNQSFVDAEMFKCPGQCLMALTAMGPYGMGYCIGMCVCPEYVAAGCYLTSLIKMTMYKHDLQFPDPCGNSQCCCGPQCLCSAFWCSPCMLCLVHRELKLRETHGHAGKQGGAMA